MLGAILVSEWIQQTDEPGWAAWLVGTAFTVVACTFARRLRMTVEQLREAQHQLAERSRAEERNRIAAEVHDVVGHALTVSLLHIGSARLALDEEPRGGAACARGGRTAHPRQPRRGACQRGTDAHGRAR